MGIFARVAGNVIVFALFCVGTKHVVQTVYTWHKAYKDNPSTAVTA